MANSTAKLVDISKEVPWASGGVRVKPDECKYCRYSSVGAGFCPDFYPKSPILGIMLPNPSKDDIINQRPLTGSQGYYWMKLLVEDLGYKREDVLISHVLRCLPPRAKKGGGYDYPTGTLRANAETSCRRYDKKHAYRDQLVDGGILKYDPNLFLVSYDPNEMFSVPAFQRQLVTDMSKAFRFAALGYRPLVLMGKEAMEMVAPWLAGKGGVKTWRGHWWEGTWPFDGEAKEKLFFTEASDTGFRRKR